MNIKLKKFIKEGTMKVENKTVIREVLIKEDIMHPGKESIAICFSNKNSSGMIEISKKEFEKLSNSIEPQLKLAKLYK